MTKPMSARRVPASHPVRPLKPGAPAGDRVTCNTCGLSWDDSIVTSYTPAPSARCPFEAFHLPSDPCRYDRQRECTCPTSTICPLKPERAPKRSAGPKRSSPSPSPGRTAIVQDVAAQRVMIYDQAGKLLETRWMESRVAPLVMARRLSAEGIKLIEHWLFNVPGTPHAKLSAPLLRAEAQSIAVGARLQAEREKGG